MTNERMDYSRKWYVMAAVGMSILLSTIDATIVNIALPTLVRDLDTDFPTVQWVVLSYLLIQATLMLSVGRLGDMLGKKPLFTSGFIVFTIGSVLCGLAPSVYWLIGFRMVQAVGAAMLLALGMAIITESFPPSERGKALGISGTIISVGIVIGPALGGLIVDALSWRWIFFVNLPVGIIGTMMAIAYIPALKPSGRQRFDYLGAITLFLSLLAFLLALTWGQQLGFTDSRIVLLLAGSLLFLVAFILIEWRSSEPMIDLKMFRNNLFSVGLITGFLTFFAIAGVIILMPFFLENVLGYSTREVGLLLAAVPIVMSVIAPLSGSLSDRFGTRLITVIGLLILLGGYYALGSLNAETTAVGYLLRLLPIGIGMGVFQSPNNSAIMGAVIRERLGIASGLLSVTRVLGQTTGIAVLGALWASRVMAQTGTILSGGATIAPPDAQVAGLQDTFAVVLLLMVVAIVLSTWGLVQERRLRRQTRPAQAGS
jgi:EmrB/QacA subfamily drug resistance transporter